MSDRFKGTIGIDIRESVPDWEKFEQPKAPEGSPNILFIVWDDVGFGAMEPFGGSIETPTMERLAENGISYSQFHTTALCSPTRACLLTGRNHTTVGMACIEEASTGFPGSSGRIPNETATLAEVLVERGYNTYALGKWHLVPEEEANMASSKRNWPTGRGFERFYGFLGGETSQWYPDLTYDNHMIEPPAKPEEGYHLSKDLADQAIKMIRDSKQVAPDKPFFMFLCPGCAHAPHQVWKEWADRYRGKFDDGYEKYREVTLERQKKMGLLPPETELTPINPLIEEKGPDGQEWPALDTVRPWDSLTDDEKRLFARMAEVYAGFVSYTDDQIGRAHRRSGRPGNHAHARTCTTHRPAGFRWSGGCSRPSDQAAYNGPGAPRPSGRGPALPGSARRPARRRLPSRGREIPDIDGRTSRE